MKIKTSKQLDEYINAYETYGHSYIERRLAGKSLFNDHIEAPVLHMYLETIKNKKGKIALDIGCGPGIYTKLLADKGLSVHSIDPSPLMLNAAKFYLESNSNVRVNFSQTTFEEADFGDDKFDIILATFMIGYFEDLTATFKKMRKLLAEGGKIITSELHPFRLFSNRKGHDGHETTNYWSREPYMADFLCQSNPIPLYSYNFEDLFEAVDSADLAIEELSEPRLNINSNYPDRSKINYYSNNPSILILRLKAK